MNDAANFMKCPACGAVNRIDRDTTCWVCDQPLDLSKSVWLEFYEGQEPPPTSHGFGAGGCLMAAVFLMVAVGLTLVAPGLGILLIVFSIIPLIRTLFLVDPAKDPGKAFSLYVTSVVVSIVIVTVLGVVAFGAFCLSLFGVCIFEPRGGRMDGPWHRLAGHPLGGGRGGSSARQMGHSPLPPRQGRPLIPGTNPGRFSRDATLRRAAARAFSLR